jgi:L,D-peptidoglycan transpeptidase YkuD (ErfK/YbiS/YcfS/YnhG family)
MNRHHFCAKQNGRHQAGSDQSRKQMRRASVGMVTDHDTAKLFPRPGAAIKFHLRRSSKIAKRFEGTKGRQP